MYLALICLSQQACKLGGHCCFCLLTPPRGERTHTCETLINKNQTGKLRDPDNENIMAKNEPHTMTICFYWTECSTPPFLKNKSWGTKQVVLGGSRKVAEQETGEKASKHHSSMVSASVPVFRFLSWVPSLTFLSDRQLPGIGKPNKPLIHQVFCLFGW